MDWRPATDTILIWRLPNATVIKFVNLSRFLLDPFLSKKNTRIQSYALVLSINDSDPGIQYGLGWVNKPNFLAQTDPKYPMYGTLHETVNQTDLTYSFFVTTEPKANFAFDFSVLDPSVAKKVLNGSGTVQFLVFQTFALPRGKAIPLTLTHLVVQNSTTNPNSSVPTTTPTPPAAPNAGANGPRRPHLAIILGCCGVAALALLILAPEKFSVADNRVGYSSPYPA
ncbi:hypothetical protein GALMADRAFT_283746 [Galerina marginata CBS 339.88]|uniref:Uncharacterized protein n=1 Tax=Galerina marginata (strain CBS 339.88) TaxID=685588 RepID=A0A067S7X0_GALM3|nr:hypothetical protein GALMADRAFT_283746 [Galerina marginata CBS 339.88]